LGEVVKKIHEEKKSCGYLYGSYNTQRAGFAGEQYGIREGGLLGRIIKGLGVYMKGGRETLSKFNLGDALLHDQGGAKMKTYKRK